MSWRKGSLADIGFDPDGRARSPRGRPFQMVMYPLFMARSRALTDFTTNRWLLIPEVVVLGVTVAQSEYVHYTLPGAFQWPYQRTYLYIEAFNPDNLNHHDLLSLCHYRRCIISSRNRTSIGAATQYRNEWKYRASNFRSSVPFYRSEQRSHRIHPLRLRRPDREQPPAHRLAGAGGAAALPGVVRPPALPRPRACQDRGRGAGGVGEDDIR